MRILLCVCDINLWVASRFIIRMWKCHWNSEIQWMCWTRNLCPSERPVQHSHGLVHTAHYLVLDILRKHQGQLKNSYNFCWRETILCNFVYNTSSSSMVLLLHSAFFLWAESTPWFCDYVRPLVQQVRMKACHIMYSGKILDARSQFWKCI